MSLIPADQQAAINESLTALDAQAKFRQTGDYIAYAPPPDNQSPNSVEQWSQSPAQLDLEGAKYLSELKEKDVGGLEREADRLAKLEVLRAQAFYTQQIDDGSADKAVSAKQVEEKAAQLSRQLEKAKNEHDLALAQLNTHFGSIANNKEKLKTLVTEERDNNRGLQNQLAMELGVPSVPDSLITKPDEKQKGHLEEGVSQYEQQRKQIDDNYKAQLYTAIGSAGSVRLENDHNIATAEVAQAKQNSLEKAEAQQRLDAIENTQKMVQNARQPSADKLIDNAPKYVQDVADGDNARAALSDVSGTQLVAGLKTQLEKIYADRVKTAEETAQKQGRLLTDQERNNITADRDSAVANLQENAGAVATQFAYEVKKIDGNHALLAQEKSDLKGKLLEYTVDYKDDPDQFVSSFAEKHNPSMAPAKLNDLEEQAGGKIRRISFAHNGMQVYLNGSGKPINIDPKLAEKAINNGLDFQGSEQHVELTIDSTSSLTKPNQKLALIGAPDGQSIRATYSNLSEYSIDTAARKKMYNTIAKVEAVGEDHGFTNNKAIVMEGINRGAAIAQAQHDLGAAKQSGELASIEQRTQQFIAAAKSEKPKEAMDALLAASKQPQHYPSGPPPHGPHAPNVALTGQQRTTHR